MSCSDFREAISAGLDGESPGIPQVWVDDHLERCVRCRGWAEAAAEVTRRARLVPAGTVPDLTAAVLGQLPTTGRPRRQGWARWPDVDVLIRWLLVAVGVGQWALGSEMLGAAGGTAMGTVMPLHLSHETGAWNLGLAACFLVAAARPRLALGALPFLLSFTGLLSWATVADLRAGNVPADRAADHLFVVAGAVLVSLLAYRRRAPGRRPVGELIDRLPRWAGTAGRNVRSGTGSSTAPSDAHEGGPIVASASRAA